MFKIVNHVLHSVVLGMLFISSDYDPETLIIVVMTLMFGWFASHRGIDMAGRPRTAGKGAIAISIVLLYWVGYLTKLGVGLFWSDKFWVVPELISAEGLVREMPRAFALAMLGYAALSAALLTFPLGGGLHWEVEEFRPRIVLLSVLLPMSLLVKYLLKARFNLGVPGYDPEDLGIPFLAGFLAFVTDAGYVFASNILLFCGLVLGRTRLMLYGLLLGLANAGIDLRFGSKDTLMYQLAITAVYLAIARYSMVATAGQIRRTVRLALFVLGFLGITVIGSYKYFNHFRFAMQARTSTNVTNVDMSAALDAALSRENPNSQNALFEIYNRITGLDTLAAVIRLSDKLGSEASVAAMIDGSVIDNFKYYVHGTSDSMTMFSITQFGYYYTSGGIVGLGLGCLLLGYSFCLIQYLVLLMHTHNAMKLAFLPALWILYIKSLLGGGNALLWFKEVAVVVFTFLIAARVACSVRNLPSRSRNLSKSVPVQKIP
jgi:hypothetical protein